MSERVVPMDNTDNNTLPISGLEDLQTHIAQLVGDPLATFDAKLFDHVELQLNESNIPPLLSALLPPLTSILRQTTQDPTPLLTLTIKLLAPLPFPRCLTIADPPSLITALRSPLPGANLLALAILHKAARSPSDAAILSTLPDVVEELVRCWLDNSDVGVGERAARVLGDILETDCDVIVQGVGANGFTNATTNGIPGTQVVKRHVPGHARVWQLLFLDRSFITLIVTLCQPEEPTRQSTLAQGRLLRFLTRATALNPRLLATTPFPDLLPAPDSAGQGLLQWAALSMVEQEDILMHLSVIDFFETFVSIMRIAGSSADKDKIVKDLVRTAGQGDEELAAALRALPDRTVEEEAEPLARYISQLLD